MIYFVRHGSTDWNDNVDALGNKCPRCQGRADIPLNAAGIAQAEKTKKQLEGIVFKRIICSPLLRARQTCDIVSNKTAKVEVDARLIERDFGEVEGLTRDEFDFYAFWNSKTDKKFARAETIHDVEVRVFDLLNELAKNPQDDVLLVSHAGVGCVLMSYFQGVPDDGNYLSFEVPNGRAMTFQFGKAKN